MVRRCLKGERREENQSLLEYETANAPVNGPQQVKGTESSRYRKHIAFFLASSHGAKHCRRCLSRDLALSPRVAASVASAKQKGSGRFMRQGAGPRTWTGSARDSPMVPKAR